MAGRNRIGVWIILSVAVACGCGKPEAELIRSAMSGAAQQTPRSPQEVIVAEGFKLDVTEAEARAYTDRLLSTLRERRDVELPGYVDYQLLANIALRGMGQSRTKEVLIQGFVQGVTARPQGVFEGALQQAAEFRLMRIMQNARGRNVLVRVLMADAGFNYFELQLVRSPAGKPIASDVYVYALGENFSDTIRRLIGLNTGDASLLSGESISSADAKRSFATIDSMVSSFRDKRFADTVEAFRRLPESLQRDRACLAMQMSAAQQISDDSHRQSLAVVRKYHADSDWTNLLLLDDDFYRKDFDGALRRVDRLDTGLGGDPYLDVLRATLYSTKGDHSSAVARAEQAIAREATLRQAHDGLLTVALAAGRFDLVRRELLYLENEYGDNLGGVEHAEMYEAFRKSKEYESWKSARKR